MLYLPWPYLVAACAVLVGGLAVWLDYRHKGKLADIVKASIQAGQTPPKEVLDALTDASADENYQSEKSANANGGALTFFFISVGFGIGAWWAWPGKAGVAFAAVAAITGAAAIISWILAFVRRAKPTEVT